MMAEQENMDISELTEEHDVTPPASMDSSKVSPIPFISVKSKYTFTHDGGRVQAQEVAPDIPNPTIGCTDTKKPGEKKQFYEKNDEDILPIVGSDDDVDNFGIKHRSETPASHYTEGETKYTTKDALKTMAQNIEAISGETGCIINETCRPEHSRYIQNIDFRSVKYLGHGSFGKVDLCVDSKTKKAFVRKIIEKAKFKASEAIAPTILVHPNITKVFGVVQRDSQSLQNSKIEIYMEYGGDSLFNFCKRRTLSSSEILNLAKQGLQGLKHMDLYKIKHLDIKPENICIMEDNGSLSLKITDFGTSSLSIDRLEFGGVTPEYMAPELCKCILQLKRKDYFSLSENDITGAADVFAFALVIMFMYTRYHIMVKVINKGQPTYKGIGAEERKQLQASLMDWMARDDGSLVQNLIPDECSLDMRDLLIGMTRPNHEARLTAEQACDLIEGIAGACLMSEFGPVKNKATRLSVKKNQPYDKSGFYGKGAKKLTSMTPMEELHRLRQEIASKKLQIPSTPVSKFEKWNLEQTSQKQQACNKTFETTARCIPGAKSLPNTSTEFFQDIKAARFPGHDTTYCIGQPKLVATSLLNNTSVQSTANIGRSQLQPQALTGNGMVTIPADVFIRLLQRAQCGQSTVTREADIQPPIISPQAEGLGTKGARHQPEHTPMEESPPVNGNIPNFLL